MAQRSDAPDFVEPGSSPRIHFYVLALIVLVFAIVRIRMMNIPLERDEGEYAYAGQLLLQGIAPYKLAFNMKLPGTYLVYALIMGVLGQSGAAIHTGLLAANMISILLLFFLTRRILDSLGGLVAAASYAILSASPSVLGFAGHATHFVVLAALAGLLLMLQAIDSQRKWQLALSGMLLGLGFLMKQPGIFFVFFAFLWLVRANLSAQVRWRDLIANCAVFATAALPFLLTCLWLWKAGVFARFWFWTFTYGRLYGTMMSLHDAFGIFLNNTVSVARPEAGIWILAAMDFIFLWLSWESSALFLSGFFLFSFLAVCPGFYFREHYFIVLLPAIAMLAAAAISVTTRKIRERATSKLFASVPAIAFLAAFGIAFAQQWTFWFEMDPIAASRSVYGPNPFPEAVEIAKFIRTHTAPSASIAVLGSEPEICFYARRHSATGYIYTYPLMEEQPYALTMQQEMISQIEQAQPEFLVFVNVSTSWLRREGSQTLILQWAQKYVADHYSLDGMVDILGDSHYVWGADARNYRPTSRYTVEVFKRTSS